MKIVWQVFLIIVVISAAFFYWFRHERQSAKNEVLIEEKQQIIEEKNGVIETKNFQQKLIKSPVRSADLAARDEWLQLLWQKSN
jgi:hypothetical protein